MDRTHTATRTDHTRRGADGSRTLTINNTTAGEGGEEDQGAGPSSQPDGVLRLRAGNAVRSDQRRVVWAEDTVDNEGMGKKKSKICCIYHKPKAFDESSSEGSSSSGSDSDSDSSDSASDRESASERSSPPSDSGPSVSQAMKQRQRHRDRHGKGRAAHSADCEHHGEKTDEGQVHHEHHASSRRKKLSKRRQRGGGSGSSTMVITETETRKDSQDEEDGGEVDRTHRKPNAYERGVA